MNTAPAVDPALAASVNREQELRDRVREASAARRAINAGPEPDKAQKLREACQGFEALFIQKMWEGMRASLPQDGLMHSRDEKFWQGMYDQELGKSMARAGGIGLADMMVAQLSRNLQDAGSAAAASVRREPLPIAPVPLLPQKAAGPTPEPAAPADIYSGEAPQPAAPEPAPEPVETDPVRSALEDLMDRAGPDRQLIISRTIRSTTEASADVPHLPADHPVVTGRRPEAATSDPAGAAATPWSAPMQTAWQPVSAPTQHEKTPTPPRLETAAGRTPPVAPGAASDVRPQDISSRKPAASRRTAAPAPAAQPAVNTAEAPASGPAAPSAATVSQRTGRPAARAASRSETRNGPEIASLQTAGKTFPRPQSAFSRSATALLKEQFGTPAPEKNNS